VTVSPDRTVSAIKLLATCLHLTPLITLSTRNAIDQIIVSLALKRSLDPEIVCALHEAIVTSVIFPAGPAILPHAIKIIERDSAHSVEKVRNSAAVAGREIELILHPRLPAQKSRVSSQKMEEEQAEEGDEEESVDGMQEEAQMETDNVEELPMEMEIFDQDEGTRNGLQSGAQPSKDAVATVQPMNVTQLPSFVSNSSNEPPVKSVIAPMATIVSEIRNVAHTTPLTTAPEQKKDLFTPGTGKNLATKEEESDDEIPEIDMGFDTDEESE
jgi:hypothetical protein